mgnify:CR=1 FL=1
MNVTAECIDEGVVKQGYTLVYKNFFSQSPRLIRFLYQSLPRDLGTVADRTIITDYPDLINYDAFVIMSEAHLRPNGKVIFNAMLGHPFRHIAECLDIPIIFHTTKRYYARYAENETNLFKITTSLPSLKKAVQDLGLNSDSKVYVLNLWDLNRYKDYEYPDSDYALDFLKEY